MIRLLCVYGTMYACIAGRYSSFFQKAIRSLRICAKMLHIAAMLNHVKSSDFDLTCDVTGDPEVIKICFPSTVFSRAFKCRLNF